MYKVIIIEIKRKSVLLMLLTFRILLGFVLQYTKSKSVGINFLKNKTISVVMQLLT